MWKWAEPRLQKACCVGALQKLEMPLTRVLARMEAIGIEVNFKHLKQQLVRLVSPSAPGVSCRLADDCRAEATANEGTI